MGHRLPGTAFVLLSAAVVTGALGCSLERTPAQGSDDGVPTVDSAAWDAGDRDAALEGVQRRAALAGVPARFGYGAPADSARLASWDIDIMPDGRGLPAGSGTVSAGAAVYAARCAPCHGVAGEGGPNDRLVAQPGEEQGRTIGTWWPYSTTLFDYVRRAMPWDRPGTMSDDEVYAVVAWLLNRNGLVDTAAVMDANTLPLVEMPARDRFVPDDRALHNAVR